LSEEYARASRQPMSSRVRISKRMLFIFLAVIFLEFCHYILVVGSDNMVYPVLDMGTTSVWMTVGNYISPWFFWFTFPFVIISAGVGLAMGSRITSKGWKVTLGYTILAMALLGVCLYITLTFLTYNWIYQLVPQNIIVSGYSGSHDMHTFIQSAIGNGTVLSRYFWTAFQFVVAGVVVGFIGSQIEGEI